MPTAHSINIQSQLHAINLIDFARESVRSAARIVGVAKSTLHDNLGKFRAEMTAFEERQRNSERTLARDILALSFEGKTSSRDAAKVLSRLSGQDISHQKVLAVLSQLAAVASSKNNEKLKLKLVKNGDEVEAPPLTYVRSAAFDEIFQKQHPILGFVDPVSSFIYFEAADDRSGDSWISFLKKLHVMGLNPDSTITDGGQGMQKALKEIMPKAITFRDLFHVRQKLSKALRAFEGYCYRLIDAQSRAQKKIPDAEGNAALSAKMDKAIALFDALEKEAKALGLACYFENSLRYVTSSQTQIIISRIVALIACAERNAIKHDALKAARTYLAGASSNIVAYKKTIEQIVASQFGEVHSETILGYVCPIIEFLDQIQRSYEDKKRSEYWLKKLVGARNKFRALAFVDQREIDLVIDQVAEIMGNVKKSNSLIEAINSVIRRYLVAYKSIPTWFCPIFTFYWNHRTFNRGKRKNLKPREILTGQAFEKDWIDVLLEGYKAAEPHGNQNTKSVINADAA